jgi:hypothetical protein
METGRRADHQGVAIPPKLRVHRTTASEEFPQSNSHAVNTGHILTETEETGRIKK